MFHLPDLNCFFSNFYGYVTLRNVNSEKRIRRTIFGLCTHVHSDKQDLNTCRSSYIFCYACLFVCAMFSDIVPRKHQTSWFWDESAKFYIDLHQLNFGRRYKTFTIDKFAVFDPSSTPY